MGLAQEIAPQIPRLRRFARALSGSQKGGDAYVAAVLETIAQDPATVADDRMPVPLFRLLCRIWEAVDINASADPAMPAWEHNAGNRLRAITPRPRQALLLQVLEGFTADEVASILDVSSEEANSLIEQASAEIASQIATDVLVIEDEPITAMDLEDLVRNLGHHVTGIARTASEAVELARQERPGLVLADVQLADGSSGIEAVNEILTQVNAPVIFVTAYPERLLTGERIEPVFLIAKPFDPAVVKAMISQVLFFEQNPLRAVA